MFNIKSGVPNIVFKTLPGLKINRVELGGALGTVRLVFKKKSKNLFFLRKFAEFFLHI